VAPASPRAKVAQAETNWLFFEAIVKSPHLLGIMLAALPPREVFSRPVKIPFIITLANTKKDQVWVDLSPISKTLPSRTICGWKQ
jgi:hypothetical protein